MSMNNQGYGQMPSYGGMRGFQGFGSQMPTRMTQGYRKPMMQPQGGMGQVQGAQGYQGNPNDQFAAMQWQQNQQQPWSMYGGGRPSQDYDPNPNISGTQAVPWYEQFGFGPGSISTQTPGRYNGFVNGAAFDDQGNAINAPQFGGPTFAQRMIPRGY